MAENTRWRRPIVVSCLDDVPSEGANERRYCETIGIRAFLVMPFEVGTSIVGSVFLDSASERGQGTSSVGRAVWPRSSPTP